ncbi:hypothetical protein JB92DRAFT_997006 [Gautieria morchelliformis]|nr:hypothetical protein JB92DRAFT_997006 [Gautieria morchelliformis]
MAKPISTSRMRCSKPRRRPDSFGGLGKAVYCVTLVLLTITAIFKVLIVTILFTHWRTFRHVQRPVSLSIPVLMRCLALNRSLSRRSLNCVWSPPRQSI